jgi:hypothetical protein
MATSDDKIYSVTWPAEAKHLSDYSVTHYPLGGLTHLTYNSYDELRSILRKIRDYEPAPF